jgi:competence protein ComEC
MAGALGGSHVADAAPGLAGAGGLSVRPARRGDLAGLVRASLSAMLAREVADRRLFLWLPIFFLIGILAYFAAPREPGLAAPFLAAVSFGAIAFLARARGAMGVARVALAAAFLFAGFAAGVLRSATSGGPVLDGIRIASVTAYIETLDDRRGGARLLLRPFAIDGVASEKLPECLRVTIRHPEGLAAGQTIRAVMRLIPPAEPAEPGGYDFSREAYFAGIGGVGSILSRVEFVPDMEAPMFARINAAIDRARNDLTYRIARTIGGEKGALAAALVTGKRGLISEETNEALRGAGIYHVVSISGLHMVLAAGLFMWSLRALLALSPAIALRYPVKKIAAGFAIVGAFAYCIFAGSEVATERSLIMISIMLGAVLFDRPALSMRNLALAALIVMAREPETILGPSFQMSFGAVAAMIALFERSPGQGRGERPPGFAGRIGRAVLIMLATTFIAGLTTGPFASFHFHRVNPYSIIGNAFALPLVEFIVMPAALLGVIAGPFGLDAPIWTLMGWGVGHMRELSKSVAGLSGSTRHLQAFGMGALLIMSFGFVWIVLWRSAIRFAGLPIIMLGLWQASQFKPPDLIVDAGARSMALRSFSGRLDVMKGQGNDFAVSQWLLGDGDARKAGSADLAGNSRCDALGCIGQLIDGRTIGLVLQPGALMEDCRRVDILITRLRVDARCKGPELVLDGAHFAAHGATELRLMADGTLAMKTSRSTDMERPWFPRKPERFTRAPGPRGEGAANLREAQDGDHDPRAFLE